MTLPATNRPTDQPVYWFATLEAALDDGDLEAAAVAIRELRRLGIHVQVPRWGAVPTQPATSRRSDSGGGDLG